MNETVQKIKETIESVRGFLQQDGGDIEFVDFKDGIVYVKMRGACSSCASLDATLYDGIESILMDQVPEVTGIEQV